MADTIVQDTKSETTPPTQDTKVDQKVSRREAITTALEAADKGTSDNAEEGKTDTTKAKDNKTTSDLTDKKDDKSSTEPSEDQKAKDEQDRTQGADLMRALRDPEKAGFIIKYLAEQAGYSKNEAPSTKQEVKEIKNEILEDLREGLGEEFTVIADRLAPAIEKILNKQLEKSQADIRAKFAADETEKLKTQSASALEKLTSGFFGEGEELPPAVTQEMSKFMDRVSPQPTATVKEYVEDAFHFAIGKLGLQKTDPKTKERTNKNRNDAPSRLASERGPAPGNLKPENPQTFTREQAIRAAIEAVNKEG